jgi:hypothetical protein
MIPKAKTVNKIIEKINVLTTDLTNIKDEWVDKYDNASEGWQESDNGQALEEAISKLDDLITNLEFADEAKVEEG